MWKYKVALSSSILIFALFTHAKCGDAAMNPAKFNWLCGAGSLPLVAAAVEAGASVNKSDMYGTTPLMCAVSAGGNLDVASFLIDNGVDVNARDIKGMTALMYTLRASSAEEGHQIVSLLLGAGADVNARDVDGVTVLMHALNSYLGPRVISLLLKAGADVNARDKAGKTALMNISETYSMPGFVEDWDQTWDPTIVESLSNSGSSSPSMVTQSFSLLLNAGAMINVRDNIGRTALMLAAGDFYGAEKVSLLIKAGADVNVANNEGRTAFMYAAESYNEKLFPILIKAGANINAADKKGRTALIRATIHHKEFIGSAVSPEIILALLEHNADAKIRDKDGKNALDYAVENKVLFYTGRDVYYKLIDSTY